MPANSERRQIVLDEVFPQMAPWVRGIHVPLNESPVPIARGGSNNFKMK